MLLVPKGSGIRKANYEAADYPQVSLHCPGSSKRECGVKLLPVPNILTSHNIRPEREGRAIHIGQHPVYQALQKRVINSGKP